MMKKLTVWSRALLVFVLVFHLSSGIGIAQDSTPFLSIGDQISKESDVLGESRDIIVGLPLGYEEAEDSYPVVYLLDGPFHFHHTTGSTRFLAGNGRMPEAIVVGVPNTDRTRDLTPPNLTDSLGRYPSAGGADNFIRFLKDELRPHIDSLYRTRPYSILIGHSFGGLFAMHTLVHHPDAFDAYIAISPSLWWDDQRLVAQADSVFDDSETLNVDLYMTMGNEGNDMLGGALKVAGILEEKAPKRFRWDFKLMENESHGSVPHRSTYDGFEFIFDGWNLHDPMDLFDLGGLAAIDNFFIQATKKYGYEKEASKELLYRLGSHALETENGNEAANVFTRILDQEQNKAIAYVGLADAYTLIGNTEEAVVQYKNALELNPRNKKAREELTALGIDLSDYPEDVEVPIDVLESYVGEYLAAELTFIVTLVERNLVVSAFGQETALYPITNDRFGATISDEISITFRMDDTNAVQSMYVEQTGFEVEAMRTK